MKRAWPYGLAVMSALCVLACGERKQESLPTSLADATVPADFTFATTQAVTVDVKVSAEVLPAGETGALVIASPTGRFLYRGAVQSGIPLQLKLALPTAQTVVDANLATTAGVRPAQASISNASASLRFE